MQIKLPKVTREDWKQFFIGLAELVGVLAFILALQYGLPVLFNWILK